MLEGLVQHDHPLTLQHVLGRMRNVYGDERGRHAHRGRHRARDVRRGLRAGRPAGERAQGARGRAGRPRRDVRLEHAAPPRGLPRRAVHRAPCSTRSTSACSRSSSPTSRTTRRTSSSSSTPSVVPLMEKVADTFETVEHFVIMGDGDARLAPQRDPLRGAARRPAGGASTTPRSTTAPPPGSVTRAARPATRRACSTRTARRSCTRSAPASPTRWACARPTACCRSCRCSTPTRGASRTRPGMIGCDLIMPGAVPPGGAAREADRRGAA